MLVKDYMTRHPLMAEPEMSIVDAQRYMGENDIRHLPVVGSGKRLLGLVTRQTLLVDPGKLGSLDVWEITRYLSHVSVADVMVPAEQVITIPPDTAIETAARVMVENRVGSLPVVEEGIVVGMITDTDMLNQLMEMMGARVSGVRVTIRMSMSKGELAKLVSAVAAKGWGIEALGGVLAPKDPDKWDAVVKLREPRDEVAAVLGQIEGQEIIDIREM